MMQTTIQLHAIGEAVTVGPWRITVNEAIGGEAAADLVRSWHENNPDPPEGLAYAVARLTVEHLGNTRRVMSLEDFMATGNDGILRHPPTIAVAETAIRKYVEPAETVQGVVPLLVDAFEPATLWFDSVLLGGNWTAATFALGPQAAVPSFETPPAGDPEVGMSPDDPAPLDVPVISGDWEVALLEMQEGPAVFAMAGPELRRLGESSPVTVPDWLAVRGRVRNIGSVPACFSPASLAITDTAGEVWDDILTLSPRYPDLGGTLLPGASTEGWVGFHRYDYDTKGELYSEAAMIRVCPSELVGQPRYIALPPTTNPWETGVLTVDDEGNTVLTIDLELAETTANDADPDADDAMPVGATAATNEDRVNLREETSLSGDIVAELPEGTAVTITGDVVGADGQSWYPVEVVDTGETGFIAAQFLSASADS